MCNRAVAAIVARMERTTVRRTVELECDAATLWRLISDAGELGAWLGEDVHLDLRVGGSGRLVDDDGVRRDLVVTGMTVGERLAFTWWPAGDEPGGSDVAFTVEETDTGSRLVITESADPSIDGASARALSGSWETRVVSLWMSVCSLTRV
jgi:uncharacterized protein YndB with AHSA1/START domain